MVNNSNLRSFMLNAWLDVHSHRRQWKIHFNRININLDCGSDKKSCGAITNESFEEFLSEFKQIMYPDYVTLSASFDGSIDALADAFDYSTFSKHLDFLQFWANKIDNTKRNNSNYMSYPTEMVDRLEKHRLSPNKIVIGVQKFNGFEREILGAVNYYELQRFYCAPGSVGYSYCDKSAPIGVSLIENHHLEIESADSIAKQVRFAMKRNLAGIVSFGVNSYEYLSNSEFAVNASSDLKPANDVKLNILKRNYPLISTIETAMISALDELDQEKQLQIGVVLIP